MKERDATINEEYTANENDINTSSRNNEDHNMTKRIGFLDDLRKFSHLNFLTLSDNELSAFPLSICNISTLRELNLSRNR